MWLRVLMCACVMMNLMLTSRSRLIQIRLLAERAEQLLTAADKFESHKPYQYGSSHLQGSRDKFGNQDYTSMGPGRKMKG